MPEEIIHHKRVPRGLRDHIAHRFVRIAAGFADMFFREHYGHRAVVLETIAGVPGMVGALLLHLKSLRRIQDDRGWIESLVHEAVNERFHLMVYVQITKPTFVERGFIIVAQIFFFIGYFIIYLISPKTGHRIVGYLEEEAVESYTSYLKRIEAKPEKNVPAPLIAIRYWNLSPDARLLDVIRATREDEVTHRDRNHRFADEY